MNTYRAIVRNDRRWTVEWSKDGIVQTGTFGLYDSEAEAFYAAFKLSRIERGESFTLPDTDNPHPAPA